MFFVVGCAKEMHPVLRDDSKGRSRALSCRGRERPQVSMIDLPTLCLAWRRVSRRPTRDEEHAYFGDCSGARTR
jgi:hypothetical protein